MKVKEDNTMAIANKTLPIELIRLTEIEADKNFNVRSSVETTESETDENHTSGLKGLVKSILTKSAQKAKDAPAYEGQDTPIKVRKQSGKGKKPYYLIAGFRRFAAFNLIAEERGDKDLSKTLIKAEIYEATMTDDEAKRLNIRENTARDNLSAADLCHGIAKIMGMTPGTTTIQLADDFQVAQGYVSKLWRIHQGTPAKILTAWRSGLVNVATDDLEKLSKLPTAAEKEAAWKALTEKPEKSKGGRGSWDVTAKKEAEKIGTLFGKLERDGHIELNEDEEGTWFSANIRALVNIPKLKDGDNATSYENKVESVADVAAAAYVKAKEAEPDADETANGATSTPANAKKAKAKGKGAKAATAN